jgi:chromosome partitioning protein
VLPQSHAYVRCAEQGLTLFDVPQADVAEELTHWRPLLQWLRPLLQVPANAVSATSGRPVDAPAARDAATPVMEQPKPETLSRGPRSATPGAPADAPPVASPGGVTRPAAAGLRDALALPRFLQRKP